ncbi:MAG: fused MFS/spermidine synthase [Gemmatimonadota bacterium]|jgi:predicted membrane-bound spermidine synthase
MTRLLYAVFFLSGLAGLVYEIVWSRYLALLVGHSAYAQVVVLTIFLGGLSLGALLVGQVSERIRRPLLAYAAVELIVGVAGLLFHEVFTSLEAAVRGGLLPSTPGRGVALVQWMVGGAIILPQSVLLGTTFPLVSAALLRRDPGRPGRTLGLLYFVNSLGAAVGALLTGFLLVGAFGLPGAVAAGGCLSCFVAGVAGWVAWRGRPDPVASRPAAVPVEVAEPSRARRLWIALLGLAFGTAVASFTYEIVWVRMLSLVLGSATHSFEVMLSAFILGIALGAVVIERRIDRLGDPLGALAAIQWIMGFAALATLPVYVASFSWTAALVRTVPATPGGYAVFNLARYGIALAVMLPSTFCAGMTLPLLTRILVVSGKGERSIGWVYGVNTVGSIVGVVTAALLLLPALGVELLLLVGAGLDMALGAAVLHLRPGRTAFRRRVLRLAWGTTGVVLLGVATATHLDPLLLTAGVFRTGSVPGADARLLYYEDGRTATVSVIEAGPWRAIATNGKTDASVHVSAFDPSWIDRPAMLGDEPTQLLVGLLPLAYHDDPERVAVIGQGSGVTSHYLLASPEVEELRTIEIEPRMIEGSRAFLPANRRVFEDPRSAFVVGDARSVLQNDPEPWDVIVSEPSNPWVSGVASLFTDEFYGRVADRLAPGGLLVQWLQVYELSDELVLSVLAALHRHFPSYHVYRSTGDVVVVAGLETSLPEPDWSVLDLPGLRGDLRRVESLAPRHLSMLRAADRASLAPLLDGWAPVNSDYRPVLDLGAERSRFAGQRASGLLRLGTDHLHVASPYLPPGHTLVPGPPPFPGIERVEGLSLNRSLRAAADGRPLDELSGGETLAQRFYELTRFRAAMEGGRPPGDWLRWTQEAQRMVSWLHAGMTGVADESVFDELHRYLDRAGAPPNVVAAVDFLRDSHAWDFAGTVAVGRPLLDEARRGRLWVRADVLMDGLVTASLRTGDVDGALESYSVLRPLVPRTDEDIRIRLLKAHLDAARGDRP